MDYKMIVLDLDGTLTNRDKVITPRTKAALIEAQKKGTIVVLASGRPTYGVLPLAEELELENYGGYVLSFNGGIIYNCQNRQIVFQKQLPQKSNWRIIRAAKQENVDILTYENDTIITNNAASEYVTIESRINHLKIKQIDDLESYVNFTVPKFLMVGDGNFLAGVENNVKDILGDEFSIYRSDPYFLEILPQGIDKAQCLGQLLHIIGIDTQEMIACGDGYNDLTMIQFAGLGVAMENAVPPVLAAADYITASNNDDGVAQVVEKFLL
jgi:hypothetical protein